VHHRYGYPPVRSSDGNRMEALQYRLALEFRSDSLEYAGRLEIRAPGFPTSLVLDSIGHSVRSVSAGDVPLRFERDEAAGRLAVHGIPAGAPSLLIEYGGVVADQGVRGFYASPLGSGRLLSTYFEPVGARRLLPCLDRPAEKATFALEVTAPSGLTLVSNMPAELRTTLADGRQHVRFLPTPPVSSYLLFLAIGPLEEIRSERSQPAVIVAAAPGRAEEGRFALREASRAIDYFAEYYSEPYPLPKLHLVALPHSGGGAMENWGAIAFQDYLLLLSDKAPISSKMRCAEVLCHEIAHQWFGDLVTMRSWNDLWLNEGFASFVAIKALESLYPDWSAWDEFLTLRYSQSMLWDALPHTHPVRADVLDPELIRQVFDEISYGKGASFLRMGEAYLGEAAFRRGVSQYIARHRWSNAEAADLWRAIGETSGEPAARLFSEWVERPGFPVVRAQLDGTSLHLDQRRFTLLGPTTDRPWPIPLTVRAGATDHRVLFDQERAVLDLGHDELPVINPGRTGYYRVQYVGPLRERLLAAFPSLPPVDRWGLVNDGVALFLSGATDLGAYLELLQRLETDPDPFVVSEAIASLFSFYPLVHQIPPWESALVRVVRTQSERLGVRSVPGESDRTRLLREMLTSVRVRLDLPFAAALAPLYGRLESLEPELVEPVLSSVARTAGPKEYAALRARLANASSNEAARHVAAALGAVPRGDWVRESLDLGVQGELPLGPWLDVLVSVLVFNPDRAEAAWSFLKERGDALAQVTAGTPLLGIILQHAIPLLGLTRPDEMRAWISGRTFPESDLGITKGLDLLEVYSRVLDRSR